MTRKTAGAEFIESGVRQRSLPPSDSEDLYRRLLAIAEASAVELAASPPFDENDLYDAAGLPA